MRVEILAGGKSLPAVVPESLADRGESFSGGHRLDADGLESREDRVEWFAGGEKPPADGSEAWEDRVELFSGGQLVSAYVSRPFEHRVEWLAGGERLSAVVPGFEDDRFHRPESPHGVGSSARVPSPRPSPASRERVVFTDEPWDRAHAVTKGGETFSPFVAAHARSHSTKANTTLSR